MKDDLSVTVVFDQETIISDKSKGGKIIYSKNPDVKNKNKLIEKLEKKAADDSLKFNRRKLSSLFSPVFGGCILFFGDTGFLTENPKEFIDLGGLLSARIGEYFGIDIIHYELFDAKKNAENKFFYFEIFNYNFDTHKAIKSEFIKAGNAKKVGEIAGSVLKEKSANRKEGQAGRRKKTPEPAKEGEPAKEIVAPKKTGSKKPPVEPIESAKPIEAGHSAKIGLPAETSEACKTEFLENIRNIGEQVSIISSNWSKLSPAENIPILEDGEPSEISGESSARIYFQKPNIRQVVWRFRKKPEAESSKLILRVYKELDMLWYEVLECPFGSRYIILPEPLELSQTWVEIGYLTDNGEFIFIARSPIWPPSCLFKKLPVLKLENSVKKNMLLIGATESIPGGMHLPVNITSSGAGFLLSGAGMKRRGQ
jgi:hypothetical protein